MTSNSKDVQEEEPLQAVILADSFNTRFKPLTRTKPRCLLPICNAPLLDWTFESLSLAGVREVFVICRSHVDLIKSAIADSKWSKPSSGLTIVPIVTAKEAVSPGDAMRDIYTHGIITTDFVLVTGDLVSNIHIDEVVRVHKERRKENKNAIMTMLVKESGLYHRTRPRGETSVFVLDAETSECLHYESVLGYPPKTHTRIPREILTSHSEIEIRNDLIDCSIDVCSVEVPSLFQDNFDYQDIRRDFVRGVLTSDLLQKNIHCHIVKEGYAARVKDTRSYAAVSKDILSRWTFPLVPDDNHPAGHNYDHLRGNRYVASDNSVQLSHSCIIGNNTLLGANSVVGQDATVTSSVLGQNVSVGQGSAVRDCYIWDNVNIGARCVLERSIIGCNVTIKDGSYVGEGCLIGDGVVIGPNATLSRFTRVSSNEIIEGEDDEELEEMRKRHESTNHNLGADSNGIVWFDGPSEDDEDNEDIDSYNNQRLLRLADNGSDLELSDDGSVTESDTESAGGRTLSPASSSTSLPKLSPNKHGDTEFQAEVRLSLVRAFEEGHSVDDAAVELKTLRMASNVPLRRVRESVISFIVEKIRLVDNAPAEQRREITKVIDRWGGLILKIGGAEAVETVSILQVHCCSSPRLVLFGQILAALYQSDVVEEDDIRKWHADPASKGQELANVDLSEKMQRCWTVGSHMIEQFDAQEDESDSE